MINMENDFDLKANLKKGIEDIVDRSLLAALKET